MKRLLSSLFMLAIAFAASAQYNVLVTGQIYDNIGNPVANQVVNVTDSAFSTLGVSVQNYTYTSDSLGWYADSITLQGSSGSISILTTDTCTGLKGNTWSYNAQTVPNAYYQGFILCSNIQTQNTYEISAIVLTANYQNLVPNYPVIVIDSASGLNPSTAVYTYTTDTNGSISDSITTNSATGTLWFMAPDSCGFTTIALGYAPNSPTTLGTAGLVLCNNVVNTGSNCNYTVSALPVAGMPNQAFFTYSGQAGSTYLWDFGDGNFSSQSTAVHTYAQAGTYYYCLQIDSCPPVCDSITVFNSGGCDPFFLPVVNGNSVDIFPALLAGQFQVVVDWGDGTVDTFTPQNIPVLPNNISHTYTTQGNYQICLTHSNAQLGCSNTHCDSVSIISVPTLQCNASFIVDTVNSQPGNAVIWNNSSFVGLSPTAQVNFLWDFGDGTFDSIPFPTHQYQNTGGYVVCLTVIATDMTVTGPVTCTSTFCDSLYVDQNGNIIYKGAIAGWTLVVLDANSIGIDEDALDAVLVYPNPASDIVMIETPEFKNKEGRYKLFDLSGRIVRNGLLIPAAKMQLDISDLVSGVYIMNIQIMNETKQLKVVKW